MQQCKHLFCKLSKFNIFIYAVVVLKLLLMGFFSSDYEDRMFMPFVQTFLAGAGNPYSFYFENNLLSSFPYPPLMLLIESIGGILRGLVSGSSLVLQNILFKLPSLVFDIIGMYYMIKLCDGRKKYVGILYFASPIVIYATYMHGQLDIIPTVFLIGALYYLTHEGKFNSLLSVLFLGFALSTKLHILAVLPLWFVFAQKKRCSIIYALKMTIFPLLILTLFMVPFWGTGFVQTVLLNTQQSILVEMYVQYKTLKLYLPILAILLIYLKVSRLNNINNDLFVSVCGVLFTVFLAFIPPMPGWYVWVVPFIAIFFANIHEEKYKMLTLYVILNGFYLIFFVFCHSSGFVDLYFLQRDLSLLKIPNSTINNLVFTLLTGFLLMITLRMYQQGVSSNSFYKRRNLPFTIGITGDSGSGKSTSLNLIEQLFGMKNILYLEGDGDHKWERGDQMWNYLTHLNPKANYLYRQARDIKTLREGNYVRRVEYDHNTGSFTKAQKVKPKKFIIMCGLHALYLPQMRRQLDLKIYIDTDETLRRFWKIQRDTQSRGYDKEKILKQIESRMPDALKYIYPQRKFGDLVLSYFDSNLKDCFKENHQVVLSLKCQISASVDLDETLYILSEAGVSFAQEFNEDLTHQTVTFDGEKLAQANISFHAIAHEAIPQMDELVYYPIKWATGVDGMIQFLILLLVSYKMRGELPW